MQQLTGFMQKLTAESLDFSKAMKAANTMAGKDAAGFKQLKGEVAELAKTIPIARDQLANGLYQVVSNGVPEDNWISFLETSARSAVGGIADINKVVGVTSTLIKNYGLEWGAAVDIQDKIQLTQERSVVTVFTLRRCFKGTFRSIADTVSLATPRTIAARAPLPPC
ncbi:MAG: phage tail tape measure protein, partial [Muribaculaceae bacterium]|nr:phage tail tape measure protein [Muribaculaceae bacterium]